MTPEEIEYSLRQPCTHCDKGTVPTFQGLAFRDDSILGNDESTICIMCAGTGLRSLQVMSGRNPTYLVAKNEARRLWVKGVKPPYDFRAD